MLSLQAFICLPLQAETVSRSISEIISLALKQSAELAALDQEETAKQSLAIQAGVIGNPTLELQGSTGSLSGSPEDRSLTIGINQELPLNNKLRLRREAIQLEAVALLRQRDNAARLFKDEIATLVIDYVLASKRQELATELVKVNQELVLIAEERLKAGDIPELDFNLAKLELVRAETRLLETGREILPQRIKIAALTGLNESDINVSESFLTSKLTSNAQELVKQSLASRPDLLGLNREREKTAIEARMAEAEALPNLTAGLFVQWQRSNTEVGGMSSINSDTQLGLRLSIPIPFFDRNQGARAAGRARLNAADFRKQALERTITAEVESAVSRLSASERLLTMFEQGIIPQLTENLKLTREAYRIGEVGLIAVIDEQKKFFEVNDSYLSALHGKRLAFIKLESAIATELSGGAQ